MESNTKLYVFAKKEVALIFIFMILIAITSFVMGVKIGKSYSLELAGVTPEDQKKVVELLSKNEESLEEIKKNEASHAVESGDIEHKLQEKFLMNLAVANLMGNLLAICLQRLMLLRLLQDIRQNTKMHSLENLRFS